MSTFAFVKPIHGLYKEAKIAKVEARILDRITNMPECVRSDKHSIELLLMICTMIENAIDNGGKKDKKKIDKKLLAIQVMSKLFGNLKPDDINSIGASIEFLHDTAQIVKFPVWKILSANFMSWVQKKLA